MGWNKDKFTRARFELDYLFNALIPPELSTIMLVVSPFCQNLCLGAPCHLNLCHANRNYTQTLFHSEPYKLFKKPVKMFLIHPVIGSNFAVGCVIKSK